MATQAEDTGRLPTKVRPTHYKLTLIPNLKTFDLAGTVSISLNTLEDFQSVILNAVGLKIQETKVLTGSQTINVINVTYDKDAQTATLDLEKTIPAGQDAEVSMTFSGTIGEDLSGLYRVIYKTPAGVEEHAVVSQMEPIDCRKVFPCFDEPALKATFATTMIADKDFICLTNMDINRTEDRDNSQKAWIFNTTPLMSTYLLAFAVGKFNAIESSSFHVPIRLYATPNSNMEHGRFALDLTIKTLEFFEGKLGLPFPLPKLDSLASPFVMGAMENWGLILYNESFLILDRDRVDGGALIDSVITIQHELAHQWFGNIVTMEFWDGLWLNESFATWASLYAANAFYNDWKVWQINLSEEYQRAFDLDSLRSSHPVEVPVKRASEINQIFDSISYSKGSCILRMISLYTGEETFLDGVKNYLKKHAYGNTVTTDLWDALTKESGKDIKTFGETWTKNVGHPIIIVTEDEDSIHIKQKRFLRAGHVQESEDTTLYPIFLGLRTSKGVDDSLAFSGREITLKKTDDFFKINADNVGLYRTLYQPDRLEKLVAARAQLTAEDRFSLVNDAPALATAGYQTTTQALRLLEQFGDDPDYIVWKGILHAIRTIRTAWMFESAEVQNAMLHWQRRLLSRKARELGWVFDERGDSYIDQQFKALIFGAATESGDTETIQAALDMFSKFRKGDHSAIHPNIMVPVYAVALNHSDNPEAAYNFIEQEHKNAKLSSERHAAATALGTVLRPDLIERTLRLMLTGDIATMDMHLPFGELTKFQQGLLAAWKWTTDNFDEIDRKMGAGIPAIDRILEPCIGNLASEEDLGHAEAFFKTKSSENFERSLVIGYEEARIKIGWVTRDRDEVKDWLAKEGLL